MRATNVTVTLAAVGLGCAVGAVDAQSAPPSDTRASPPPNAISGPHQQGAARSPAQPGVIATVSPVEFVRKASEEGMMEIKLADLALDKSMNEDVRRLATQLKQDHGKANSDLMNIAIGMSILPPKELDSDYLAMISDLSNKTGVAFDAAYTGVMVSAHARAVDLFTAGAKGRNAEAAAFAQRTLPTLQAHKQMADTLLLKLQADAAGAVSK